MRRTTFHLSAAAATTLQDVFNTLGQFQKQLRERKGDPYEIRQQAMAVVERDVLHVLDLSSADTIVKTPRILTVVAGTIGSNPNVTGRLSEEVTKKLAALSFEFFHQSKQATKYADATVKGRELNKIANTLGAIAMISQMTKTGHEFANGATDGFENSVKLLRESEISAVQAQSLISLLQTANMLHGNASTFGRMQVGSYGLLPTKSKRDMENKMLRCKESRELLSVLHTKALDAAAPVGENEHDGSVRRRRDGFTPIDGLRTLGVLGDAGFYHMDLVNECCRAALRNQKFMHTRHRIGALYNLGVLGHRTPLQGRFLQGIDWRDLKQSSDVSDCLQALAMLRHSVPNTKPVFNCVMAHALKRDDQPDAPGWSWYVDVAHSLHELNMHHHKFALSTARKIRNNVHQMQPEHVMKVLFSLGGDITHDIPDELRENWDVKVTGLINAAVQRSQRFEDEDLTSMDVATFGQALREAGVTSHKFIPELQDSSGASAAAALRRLKEIDGIKGGTASHGADVAGMTDAQKTEVEMSIKLKSIPGDELAAFVMEQSKKDLSQHRKAIIGAIQLKIDEMEGNDALKIFKHLDEQTVTKYYDDVIRKHLAVKVVRECSGLFLPEVQTAVELLEKHKLPGRQTLAKEAFERFQPSQL